jgi:polyketide synthase PksN
MPTIFFEHSSIKKLAKYLSDKYPSHFSDLKVAVTPASQPVFAQSDSAKQIQKILQEISAEFLMEDLDVETEFSEYGFDSITLTTFSNELNRRYHLDLMPTIFFEHSSIKKLAKYLSDNYLDSFSSLGCSATPVYRNKTCLVE